jgi:hypothetical protein
MGLVLIIAGLAKRKLIHTKRLKTMGEVVLSAIVLAILGVTAALVVTMVGEAARNIRHRKELKDLAQSGPSRQP